MLEGRTRSACCWRSKGVVRVGCTAEILEVVKRYEDAWTSSPLAANPFASWSSSTKIRCSRDRWTTWKTASHRLNRSATQAGRGIRNLPHAALREPIPRTWRAPRQASRTLASTLPLDLLCKQQILELRTESERQERLLRYLCDWAPHLLKRRQCDKVPEATGTV